MKTLATALAGLLITLCISACGGTSASAGAKVRANKTATTASATKTHTPVSSTSQSLSATQSHGETTIEDAKAKAQTFVRHAQRTVEHLATVTGQLTHGGREARKQANEALRGIEKEARTLERKASSELAGTGSVRTTIMATASKLAAAARSLQSETGAVKAGTSKLEEARGTLDGIAKTLGEVRADVESTTLSKVRQELTKLAHEL